MAFYFHVIQDFGTGIGKIYLGKKGTEAAIATPNVNFTSQAGFIGVAGEL